jgi:FtsZ-binding cell division protein ZapB
MLWHALRMSNQSAVASVHPLVRASSAPDPDAPDPVPIMRREMNLLRIEMEQLRGKEDEARKIKEFLLAYVERVEHLRAERDEWQQEAERLRALITLVPRWWIFWARYWLDVWETWQELTAPRRPHSDRFWPNANVT